MISVDGDVQVASVRISSTSHRVRVVAEDRRDVNVDGEALVDVDGSRTTIGSVRGRLLVRVPEHTDLVVGTTSAGIDVAGPVGRIAIVTDSGRVSVADATAVDIRADSARVEVGRTSGECCIRTSSGRVDVASCGSADVTTRSGRIRLRDVAGPVRAHCVSGRVEVELTAAGDVDAETVSGRIAVAMPDDVGVRRDAETTVATWPDGVACGIDVRSVTGRVDISTR